MGSRLFVAASSHGIWTSSTGYASLGTAHTTAWIGTFASLPAGGAYRSMFLMASATTARRLNMIIGGTEGVYVDIGNNASALVPTGSFFPTADGRWYVIAITKTTGTTTPRWMFHDCYSGSTTLVNGSASTANRTAGAVNPCIGVGSAGNANYFDGRIAAVGAWNRAFSDGELLALRYGEMAWQSLYGRGTLSSAREFFFACTDGRSVWDELNRFALGSGSQPALDALSTPPGW